MLRVFQLGSVSCLVDSCLVQGDLGCSGKGAGAALTSPQFSVQGCSVETALEAASLHPAQLLGIEHKKGTLNYDSDADFLMLNDNLYVQATYIAGEEVWRQDASGM